MALKLVAAVAITDVAAIRTTSRTNFIFMHEWFAYHQWLAGYAHARLNHLAQDPMYSYYLATERPRLSRLFLHVSHGRNRDGIGLTNELINQLEAAATTWGFSVFPRERFRGVPLPAYLAQG